MPGMNDERPASSDEITIEEAMQISGRARDTLMRWKRDKKLTTRIIEATITRRQRRILFRRSEIEALAGSKEG
jgi:hypothetical protein